MSTDHDGFVQITGVSKRFGATQALNDVSLSIGRGDIHGLLGENGAGKSTLMKVLAGVIIPDAGSVSIGGTPIATGNPIAARHAGLAMAYQELSAPPNITVAEKLLLPRIPTRFGFVSRRALYAQAGSVLADWGVDTIDPAGEIQTLSLADRQHVELIAAMSRAPRVLILDEPTASLPDVSWLFGNLKELAAQGTSIIYISHKLPEISELCTHGTVLRNGRVIDNFDPKVASEPDLVELMIGRSIDHVFPPKAQIAPQPRVTIDKLSTTTRSAEVSLQIGAGEVVGVAALEGQGQRDLFYSLAGDLHPTSGTVTVHDTKGRARTVGPNFSLVPEDRKTEGLFLSMSTKFNLTISELNSFSQIGYVSHKKENRIAQDAAAQVNLPKILLDRGVAQLSGGNQQKAVFGRAILSNPKCLLLFDPTRGVDAATKVEIYLMIRQYVEDGGAVLIYSTEIPELVGVCDRVYTMYGGAITGEFTAETLTENALMSGALGVERSPAR